MRCTHGASLAEPRLLGKAWLREATRRVLIAPRRGAHFKKCLRNYLRRPEIKKNSWGGHTPRPPWLARLRAHQVHHSFKHPQTKRFVYGPGVAQRVSFTVCSIYKLLLRYYSYRSMCEKKNGSSSWFLRGDLG